MWFPQCPLSYVTSFTATMLSWYVWLSEWGKTPMDFGARPEEVDPRYAPAMQLLRRERVRVEQEELERIRKEGGR